MTIRPSANASNMANASKRNGPPEAKKLANQGYDCRIDHTFARTDAMPTIRLETTIDATPERCFALALSVDLHRRSVAHTHEQPIAGVTTGILTSSRSPRGDGIPPLARWGSCNARVVPSPGCHERRGLPVSSSGLC